MTPLWRIVGGIADPIVSVLAHFDIRGAEKLPTTGAFVLSPNHYSNLDPVTTGFIVWRLGRIPRFLAKASLFRAGLLGKLLTALGQIPVERQGRGTNQPLAAAANLVDDGLAVIIYPEGTLTRDPDLWPMRGKSGAVRTALEHDVPLIPMAHWGVQQIMPRYSKKVSLFPRKRVQVVVGDPVDLSKWRGKPLDNAALTEATDAVMADVARLLGELRGETPPSERWDPATHGQTETGRFES